MRPRVVSIVVGVLAASAALASTASAQTAFSSSAGNVRCVADWPGRTSAVLCARQSFSITLLPSSLRSAATVTGSGNPAGMVRGRIVRPGAQLRIRMDDATYRCSAIGLSTLRCITVEFGHGFVLGPTRAERF